jgi:hypothetical protein
MTMFRRDFKNNLKNEIMRDDKSISDMFDLIEVVIDLDDKLYERDEKKIRSISRKSKNLL